MQRYKKNSNNCIFNHLERFFYINFTYFLHNGFAMWYFMCYFAEFFRN